MDLKKTEFYCIYAKQLPKIFDKENVAFMKKRPFALVKKVRRKDTLTVHLSNFIFWETEFDLEAGEWKSSSASSPLEITIKAPMTFEDVFYQIENHREAHFLWTKSQCEFVYKPLQAPK